MLSVDPETKAPEAADAELLFITITLLGSIVGFVLAFAVEKFFDDRRFGFGEVLVIIFLILVIAACQSFIMYYNYKIHIGAHKILESEPIEVYRGEVRFMGGMMLVGLNLLSTLIGAFMPVILLFVSDKKAYLAARNNQTRTTTTTTSTPYTAPGTPAMPSTPTTPSTPSSNGKFWSTCQVHRRAAHWQHAEWQEKVGACYRAMGPGMGSGRIANSGS